MQTWGCCIFLSAYNCSCIFSLAFYSFSLYFLNSIFFATSGPSKAINILLCSYSPCTGYVDIEKTQIERATLYWALWEQNGRMAPWIIKATLHFNCTYSLRESVKELFQLSYCKFSGNLVSCFLYFMLFVADLAV